MTPPKTLAQPHHHARQPALARQSLLEQAAVEQAVVAAQRWPKRRCGTCCVPRAARYRSRGQGAEDIFAGMSPDDARVLRSSLAERDRLIVRDEQGLLSPDEELAPNWHDGAYPTATACCGARTNARNTACKSNC